MEFADLCQVKDALATIVQLEAELRRATGLSLNQSFAICCLAQGSRLPTQLADELRLSLPSLSRLVGALVGRGLVLRRHDGADARHTRLELSGAGRELAERLHRCQGGLFPAAVSEVRLAGLSPEA